MLKIPRRGSYTGRLAFDPETGFHLDDKGRHVVTTDEGQTWRYANRADTPHNFRYQTHAPKVITGTTDADPHHVAPLGDDAHYHPDAPNFTAPVSDPDHVAVLVTSHTDAWKEQA